MIKTKSGFANSIRVDYNFFSVVDQHQERPVRLIKYDAVRKILFIPIVDEQEKVTNRYILYQFKGRYFERIFSTNYKMPE